MRSLMPHWVCERAALGVREGRTGCARGPHWVCGGPNRYGMGMSMLTAKVVPSTSKERVPP